MCDAVTSESLLSIRKTAQSCCQEPQLHAACRPCVLADGIVQRSASRVVDHE